MVTFVNTSVMFFTILLVKKRQDFRGSPIVGSCTYVGYNSSEVYCISSDRPYKREEVIRNRFRAESGKRFSMLNMLAREDAGRLSVQTFFHLLVRWGVVGIYSAMSAKRSRDSKG